MSYRCCNVGSMDVDIGSETSKLDAKRNSMSMSLLGKFQDEFFI